MQLLAIFRKSPFGRLLFFYAAGILLAGMFYRNQMQCGFIYIAGAIFLTLVLFFVACCRPVYHTGWVTGLISGIILFAVGFVNMNVHYQLGNRLIKTAGTNGIFVMEIMDPPEVKEKTVKAIAEIKGCLVDGKWKNETQRIMIYIEKDSLSFKLLPGDRIIAKATLQGVTPPKNPGEFNYQRYLAARDIYNQVYLASGVWKAIDFDEPKSISVLAFKMQDQLLRRFQKIGLNKTQFSILSALALGYKNDLESHTKQVFSEAGVMHVMALSGFNVAVIAMALGYLLAFSDRSFLGKIFKTTIIILVIWLFAFVTGLSPSVTRAAVMISFVMAGKLMHRQVNTYNILFASAFLILTLSPGLVFDLSFQLSFVAVLGIIIYQPVIYRFFVFKNFLADKTWQLFTVSLAAQLSTLPLTLLYFHQFPVYFWLTNLYVVPLVSVITCLAGIFLLVSTINFLLVLTGKILAILLDVLYKSVVLVEILPCSLIENIYINEVQSMVLIVCVFSFGLFSIQRKRGPLFLALCLFTVFLLMNTFHIMSLRNQEVLVVSDLKGISALNIISGREGLLLSDSITSTEDAILQYTYNNFWAEHGVSGHLKYINYNINGTEETLNGKGLFFKFPWLGNNAFLEFSGKRIVILKDNADYKLQVDSPLKVDLIIASGNIKPDISRMLRLLDPELLILDSSVRNYQVVQWSKACQQKGIKYWSVSQNGVYMLKNN